jgi:hypothetical protein
VCAGDIAFRRCRTGSNGLLDDRPIQPSGIHVHVDATAFDGRTLANLAKIVYKQEAKTWDTQENLRVQKPDSFCGRT